MEPQSIGKVVGSEMRSEGRVSGPSQSGTQKDPSGRAKKKKENARSTSTTAASGRQRPGVDSQEGPGSQEMADRQEVNDLRLQVERLEELMGKLQQRLDLQESLLTQAVSALRGAQKSSPEKGPEAQIGEKDGFEMPIQAEFAGEPLVSEKVADVDGDAEEPPARQDVSSRHMLRRNMTTGHFDQLVENKVGWENSIWDISFFIGMKEVDVAGSVFTFLVLFLNLLIQFVFINIVEQSFTSSSFSDATIAAFKKWRLNFGHDASHLDSSFVSLASRLCSEDRSLEMSGEQARALSLIQNYIPTDEGKHLVFFGSQVGPVFCILCITLWVLTTSSELQRIVSQCRALLMLPRTHGIRSGTVVKQKPKGGWTLVSLCPVRIGIFFIVQLFRIWIAAWLTKAGIQFLVYTTSLRELVLKAVGLKFVLTVDELLAQALAPTQAVKFVQLLDPMKGPKRASWRGLDRRTFCSAIGILVVIGTVVPLWLAPEISRLEQARDALCAGDTQFVTTPSTYPPYTWWAKSVAPDTESITRDASGVWDVADDGQGLSFDYRFSHRMTARIIRTDLAEEAIDMKNPSILGSAWSLKAMESWGVAKGVNRFNFYCEDGAGYGDIKNAPMWYQSALDDFFEKPIRSCAAAAEFCHNDTAAGVCARSWCPVTCGCRSPSSDLILKDTESGCPAPCKDHPLYVAELASASCVERAPEVITQASDWQAFMANLEVAATDWTPGGIEFAKTITGTMGAYGCGAVTILKESFDMCREGDNYKPIPMKTLRFMCPQTCNCTPDMFDCPSSIACNATV
ncbi:unnamed protein product [Prorocentrum cordatum]|uniref:Uncharacterized protein n=1 Tax=Prorocentrum cordatum TaxID=2364126 RepID=A0ABN9U936_9DINO|nr:unnamed protein product [Polarella glacialis]